MEKMCKYISKLSMFISAMCTAALSIIMIMQIFHRKVLNDSLSWSDEVGGYLLVWIAFFGAVCALYEKKHLNIDYFTSKMSGKTKILVGILSDIFIIILLVIIGVYSVPLISKMVGMSIISLDIPRWLIYMVLPVTSLFSIIITVNEVWKKVLLLRQGGENK